MKTFAQLCLFSGLAAIAVSYAACMIAVAPIATTVLFIRDY